MFRLVNWRRSVRVLAPLVVIAAVSILDLANSRQTVVLGLVATAPLLAANLVGMRLTAVYGVLSLVAAVLLGFTDDLYSTSAQRTGQVVRISAVSIAGIIGVLAARRRMRHEAHLQSVTRVAEVAQYAVLAPIPPRLAGLALAEQYTSAAIDARIGGDLYAAVDTPFGVRLLIGDVRGKGLEAVRLASTLLGAFRERADERDDLRVLLHDLDRAVRRVADDEDFVTAVVAQVTPDGTLSLANAGHPAPLLLRAGIATVLRPPSRCPPLGMADECEVLTVELEVGDRLLLYTDGLGEARHRTDGSFFPLRRMATPALSSGSLDEGLRGVQESVRDWTGGALSDDVALLAVEVLEVTAKP
ncbi:PP2C family protein-serine/threonine phosphatase [Acidothermaceae bacterium B102]|nr:PP2C family protein-serine/threonine phosphatase [Acidothermaceae bacterium B102]